MNIFIQDNEHRLVIPGGLSCKNLKGVGYKFSSGMIFFFILLDITWYRFCLSTGVLYWSEGEPDEENDLDLNEYYFDVLKELNINRNDELKLYKLDIKDGTLILTINNCELVFNNRDETTIETICSIQTKSPEKLHSIQS